MTKEEAIKRLANAYYGSNVVIGDGKFLEMLMKFLASFLGGCPLGVRRAKAMMAGGALRKRRARAQLEYAAYEFTGGDWEATQKITEAGMAVGEEATEQEYEEFAAMEF